jgi:dephospho-CoA kinase
MDIYKEFDYTILVKCKDQLRKERIIKRDNIEEQYYLDRDSNGLEYRDSDFDFIIDNTKDYKIQLKEILNRINS